MSQVRKNLYEECNQCIAKPFCGIYSGKVKSKTNYNWCNANYRLTRALKLSNIPDDYIEANIYNYKYDNSNFVAYEKLKSITENICDVIDQGNNFIIVGGQPGTGKTFHGTTILNHYLYKTCLTAKFNFEDPLSYFVSFPELMDQLRYRRDSDEVEAEIEKIKKVPLLLLDDIGAGTLTDFVREQLYLVINYRVNHKLSSIVTSNYSLDELQASEKLGSRNVSRLIKRGVGIELEGSDRRLL
jgi:DNA replication protein DnaC